MLQYRIREPERSVAGDSPLILLLHGIGADENDLFGLAPYLDGRFFIASARAPHVLPWGGFAWFDLGITASGMTVDIGQVESSRELVVELAADIAAEHGLGAVYLCGFSQGAFMALAAALREPEKFAGVVAMSGRAMEEMVPADDARGRLDGFPIFVSHGLFDPVLPIENGRMTNEILSGLPVRLEYHEYDMGHEISPECLRDVDAWLRRELDRRSSTDA